MFIFSYPTRRFSCLIPLSLSCALDTLAGDGDGNGCTTDNLVDLDAPNDRGDRSGRDRATVFKSRAGDFVGRG
jgi:hypothetical protein